MCLTPRGPRRHHLILVLANFTRSIFCLGKGGGGCLKISNQTELRYPKRYIWTRYFLAFKISQQTELMYRERHLYTSYISCMYLLEPGDQAQSLLVVCLCLGNYTPCSLLLLSERYFLYKTFRQSNMLPSSLPRLLTL